MTIFLAIFQFFPLIVAGIQTLESAIPMSGAGKQKLDLILGIVSDIFTANPHLSKDIAPATMTTLVTAIVGRVVSLFNAFGVFHKPAVVASVAKPLSLPS
jgi:uncharacterized YccA/Bax inhibitor family protein